MSNSTKNHEKVLTKLGEELITKIGIIGMSDADDMIDELCEAVGEALARACVLGKEREINNDK
jgi:hypothetical protein